MALTYSLIHDGAFQSWENRGLKIAHVKITIGAGSDWGGSPVGITLTPRKFGFSKVMGILGGTVRAASGGVHSAYPIFDYLTGRVRFADEDGFLPALELIATDVIDLWVVGV